jgi:hypothetical protein
MVKNQQNYREKYKKKLGIIIASFNTGITKFKEIKRKKNKN